MRPSFLRSTLPCVLRTSNQSNDSRCRPALTLYLLLFIFFASFNLAFSQTSNSLLLKFQDGPEVSYVTATVLMPDTVYLEFHKHLLQKDNLKRDTIIGLNLAEFNYKLIKHGISIQDSASMTTQLSEQYSRLDRFLRNLQAKYAEDQLRIAPEVQQRLDLLTNQIETTNDTIERLYLTIKQLRVQKRYARKNKESLAALLKWDSTKYAKQNWGARVKEPYQPAQRYLEKDTLATLLEDAKLQKALTISRRNALSTHVKDLYSRHATPSFHLTGNVLNFFKSNETSNSTTTGLGIYSRKANVWEYSLFITLSQSQDTISSDESNLRPFANSLLFPGVRRYSILNNYRLTHLFPHSISRFKQKLGLGLNVNVTPLNWNLNRQIEIKPDSFATVSVNRSAIPVSTDVFLTINWLQSNVQDREIGKKFSVSTDIGLTTRAILGDVGQSKEAIKTFIGSSRRVYLGLLVGVNVNIDDLNVFFYGPILFGSKVEGLTYGQTIANFGLRGNLVDLSNIFSKQNSRTEN